MWKYKEVCKGVNVVPLNRSVRCGVSHSSINNEPLITIWNPWSNVTEYVTVFYYYLLLFLINQMIESPVMLTSLLALCLWPLQKTDEAFECMTCFQNKLYFVFLHISLGSTNDDDCIQYASQVGISSWFDGWNESQQVSGSWEPLLKHKQFKVPEPNFILEQEKACPMQTGRNNHECKICLLMRLFHRNRVNRQQTRSIAVWQVVFH